MYVLSGFLDLELMQAGCSMAMTILNKLAAVVIQLLMHTEVSEKMMVKKIATAVQNFDPSMIPPFRGHASTG